MRRGDKANIIFDKRGDIFAIGTGSDACAEHEQGSKPMQEMLCGPVVGQVVPQGVLANAAVVLGLGQTDLVEEQLIAALRAGNPVKFADLVDRKGIRCNLDKLTFIRGEEKGEPVAVFGFVASKWGRGLTLDERELSFWSAEEVTGAWDDESFAWKVRGKRLVDKLERFAQKLKEGDGVFAGTFLKKENLRGVIIAVKSSLRPEHRTAIAEAQAEWEGDQQLKASSRVPELYKALDKAREVYRNAPMPGYVSPRWKGGVVGGEVVYWLNPNHGVKADFGGPYTFEQLESWILAEEKFALRPIRTESSTSTAA